MDRHPARGETSFSLKALEELHIYTVWPRLRGGHRELRRFYAPDGSLYYQKLLSFSTALARPQPFRGQVRVPHARMTQVAPVTAKGEAIVSDYLAVGGSWISQHRMTGTWRVEVFLDKPRADPDVVGTFTLAD